MKNKQITYKEAQDRYGIVISKIKSAENWYRATHVSSAVSSDTSNIVTGYGTTPDQAIVDCIRNINKKKTASFSKKQ